MRGNSVPPVLLHENMEATCNDQWMRKAVNSAGTLILTDLCYDGNELNRLATKSKENSFSVSFVPSRGATIVLSNFMKDNSLMKHILWNLLLYTAGAADCPKVTFSEISLVVVSLKWQNHYKFMKVMASCVRTWDRGWAERWKETQSPSKNEPTAVGKEWKWKIDPAAYFCQSSAHQNRYQRPNSLLHRY